MPANEVSASLVKMLKAVEIRNIKRLTLTGSLQG
jgi:hypothetical protein